ncbi:effector-associated domain EAD1-containing protein [Streptomyces wuyuanensis]|uniref:effector-associated domain EAD1-containing protein n=1 Tax=Streptomyces wuyuanensis TaxID=1196353 RepID=UPI00379B8F05
MAGFTDSELVALAERYHEPRKARQLLSRAQYPMGRVPDFVDANSFWYDLSQELESGVMADGRDSILAQDAALYPARPIGSGQTPPPNPQPPPGPRSSLTSNQVAIWAAVITGLAAVVAAVVTGFFGLIDDDDPKGESKGSKATTSAPDTAGAGATFREQAGSGGARTYKDPKRLSITGENVEAWQNVDVICRKYAPSMESVLPDGYWYLLASKPWNGQYYAPANSFMNGDKPGESNHHTDLKVPECD